MKRRDKQSFSSSSPAFWRRYGGYIITAAILAIMVALTWYLLSGTASTKREVAGPAMVMLPPPPPPPPPEPEKLPEPEPEKVEPEMVEKEPTPVEAPSDAPTPQQDLSSDPVTINGEAQAGTDAFGVMQGRGGGLSGGGGGLGSFDGYVANELQQALAKDPRTRRLAFQDVRINLWLDREGKTTRVELVKGIGKEDIDNTVLAMVRDFQSAAKPPGAQKFPVLLTVRGRRP